MKTPLLNLRHTLLLLLLIVSTGCELTENEEGTEGSVPSSVYVLNQGNFGDGNGSITTYDPVTKKAVTAAASGFGSILQSMTLVGDRLFILANTAHRLDVFDAALAGRTAQVAGVISPRFMAVSGNKGYVTNFYSAIGSFSGGKVTTVDLAAGTKGKEITVGNNPEGIAVVGNRVYVANYSSATEFGGGTTLSVINTATDQVSGTVEVGCDGPRSLVVDADNDLWVFCTGKTLYDANFEVVGTTKGAVRVLNGTTGDLKASIALDGQIATEGPGQDVYYVPETGEIFAVQDKSKVLVFNTRTNAKSADYLTVPDGKIGAIAYDPAGQLLYLGRVAGFVESGTVSIYDNTRTKVGEFAAGIAPTQILLRKAAL